MTKLLSKQLNYFFIATCIILPSGSIYSINIKLILALVIFALAIYWISSSKTSIPFFVAPLALIAFLLFYFIIGSANNTPKEHSISQAIALFSLFSAIYLPLLITTKTNTPNKDLVLFITYTFAALCTFKIATEVLMLASTGLAETKKVFEEIFGVSFIGLDAGLFYRIHLPSDYLAPPVLYALLKSNNAQLGITQRRKLFIISLIIASIIIAYSRFLWAFSLIAIIIAIATSSNFKTKANAIIAAAVTIIIITTAFGSSTYKFFETRYLGEHAESSDHTRHEMLNALIDGINQKPLLGWGLGGSTPGYTNIEAIPWYYEIQWLGLTLQFGVIGIVIIFSIAILPALLALIPRPTKSMAGLFSLYFIWLSLGFFNGFMLTSVGGIIFLTFITLAAAMQPPTYKLEKHRAN